MLRAVWSRYVAASWLVVPLAVLAVGCRKSGAKDEGRKDDAGILDQQSASRDRGATSAACVENNAECSAVIARIDELEQRRQEAMAAHDAPTASRITLELNQQAELLNLLQSGEKDEQKFAAVQTKYQALSQLLEADLAARADRDGSQGSGGAQSGDRTGDPGGGSDLDAGLNAGNDNDRRSGGLDTRLDVSPLAYHPLENEAVQSVMREFGDLYLKVPSGDDEIVDEVRIEAPWSGYWYPALGDELFQSDDSPLAKLDRLAQQRGLDVHAAQWERERHHRVETDSWEGLCGAWAIASASHPEPLRDVEIDGIVFTVADQKGLLTKAHDNATYKTYGVFYQADYVTDGTIQDLRPEAFHRLAQVVLGEQQRSLVIDTDPGYQVWSKPLYRVRWSVRRDPEIPHAVLVHASPFATRERNSETLEPTNPQRETYAPISYTYRLYYDAKSEIDGKYRIIAGEWTEKGRVEHPDFAMLPIAEGNWNSGNEEMNRAMELVKEVIARGQVP